MKKSDKPIVALIYDFDGTLAPGNMQEYSFIKAIGKTVDEFWEESHRMADTQDADGILIYMLLMLDEARKKNISLTKESFMKFGRDVKFFPGVESWFKRIQFTIFGIKFILTPNFSIYFCFVAQIYRVLLY